MRTGRLVQLAAEHTEAAYAYCEQRPYSCAFLAGWVREGGLEDDARVPHGWLLAELCTRGTVRGLVFISDTGIIFPALESLAAEEDLIRIGQRNPAAARVLVGEQSQISRIWAGLETSGAKARQIRNQRAYVATRQTFVSCDAPLPLIPATDVHLDELVRAAGAMAREEAKDDPQNRNPSLFRERIRDRMLRGRDLVYLEDDRMLFKSNVAALSPVAGQIEGIYTLPSARGNGLGSRGTSAVTAWVLEQSDRAYLLVNEDNHGAMRLYERLGYEQVGHSLTIFVA